MIPKLTEKSNKIFESLKRRGFISEKQLKYLRCDFKKACILGKLCLLPKIHHRIFNVPGRLVISNCGTPTEKVSNIKFTYESSKEIISFLDLNVKLSEGQLETNLYIKPTDGHQYLHYSSSHPEHT